MFHFDMVLLLPIITGNVFLHQCFNSLLIAIYPFCYIFTSFRGPHSIDYKEEFAISFQHVQHLLDKVLTTHPP